MIHFEYLVGSSHINVCLQFKLRTISDCVNVDIVLVSPQHTTGNIPLILSNYAYVG